MVSVVGHIVYVYILDIVSNESACIFFFTLFHSLYSKMGWLDHLIILVLVFQGPCMQFSITAVLLHALTVLKPWRYNV